MTVVVVVVVALCREGKARATGNTQRHTTRPDRIWLQQGGGLKKTGYYSTLTLPKCLTRSAVSACLPLYEW